MIHMNLANYHQYQDSLIESEHSVKATRKTVPVQLVRTPEEVYADLIARGVNISAWSRDHGFSRFTVLDLLRGKRVGRRGEAHRAAIALGLKADPDQLAA